MFVFVNALRLEERVREPDGDGQQTEAARKDTLQQAPTGLKPEDLDGVLTQLILHEPTHNSKLAITHTHTTTGVLTWITFCSVDSVLAAVIQWL